MSVDDHPLARHRSALRILHHTLVEASTRLGADAFTLDGTEVAFRRRDGDDRTVWQATLGDWLVCDGDGWHVVSDLPVPRAALV